MMKRKKKKKGLGRRKGVDVVLDERGGGVRKAKRHNAMGMKWKEKNIGTKKSINVGEIP